MEAAGAAVLTWRFAAVDPLPAAAWKGVFHSVSAFCNAGFALWSDSLVSFRADVGVNLAVMVLVVAGGIGFVSAVDLSHWVRSRLRRRRRRLAYHTRVVLVTTGGLLAAGFVLAAAFEWENTLAGEPVHVRLMGALFLSVTARTAGFNTVATGQLTNLALVTVSVLMVIGASPGSTGGGVKTTSFAIVWARVKSHVMNREHTEMLGRSVPREIAAKAMAVMMLYAWRPRSRCSSCRPRSSAPGRTRRPARTSSTRPSRWSARSAPWASPPVSPRGSPTGGASS